MFSPDLYNIFYAGKLEELKDKQAAKKKNHMAATVIENVNSEMKQVDNAHQEESKQNETTELSQNGEVKPEEKVHGVKEHVKEIPAFKIEKKADVEKMSEKCSKCDKSGAHNVKLLKDVESLTLENKILKEKEKELQNQIKNF
ncbi:hypothetical protein Hanom_Chr10g00913561 [Helianthus anomalus]